jgi:sugar transferase (PEP-CTERM/EpsH1 system associated)
LAAANGVDARYFDPAAVAAGQTPGLAVVFTGTMSYRPNADAVCWFAREVLPAVRRTVPEARFVIVGRQPSPAVRRLAGAPGVAVTGAVPDVRPYLAGAALAVCPLRLARGVQNKVLEAMAMGRAVVASPAALEGLDAEPGRHVLAADGAAAWRQTVKALLGDPDRRGAIGRAAREHIVRNYTWEARLGPLVELCRELADGRESSPSDEPAGRRRAASRPAQTPPVKDAAR